LRYTGFYKLYILASDQSSHAGGRQHFRYIDASDQTATHPSGGFYDITSVARGSEAARASSANDIEFNSDRGEAAMSLWIQLHETLHSIGIGHAHDNPKLKEFLREWGFKNGDHFPSMSAYSSEVTTHTALNDALNYDPRYVYYRPYDVLLLEARRHRAMVYSKERQELGLKSLGYISDNLVVDSSNITRTKGQEAMAKYLEELRGVN